MSKDTFNYFLLYPPFWSGKPKAQSENKFFENTTFYHPTVGEWLNGLSGKWLKLEIEKYHLLPPCKTLT
jgi:hypothetical protein